MDQSLNRVELDRVYRSVRGSLLGESQPSLTIDGRVVRRRLGTGGAGLVYAAFDPVVDREVAVKLVATHGDEAVRAAVVTEARALAELAHPNVVNVYSVGRHGDDAYIAMELVAGQTLDVWCRGAPTLIELVETLAQVADGLAAVHEAGLCHRDVKPTNVVVGADGRPRLIDFGLARRGERDPDEAIEGTPGYRAPELLDGGQASPASDQYALFTAIETLVPGTGLRRLLRVIRRGRSMAPSARFPTMAVAAAQLRAAVRPKPRRFAWVAIGTALATGAVAASTATRPRCEPVARALTLPPALGPELARRSGGVGQRVASQLEVHLDRWSADWASAYAEVCRATWERGQQSAVELDERMACLANRRSGMAAVLDVLDATDPDTVTHGVDALASLPPPRECVTWRPPMRPSDPQLRSELDRAVALRRLGKFVTARPMLVDISGRAPQGSAALAEASLELAVLDTHRADPRSTLAGFRRSVEAAHAAGRVDLEASAWIGLMHVALARAGRPGEARDALPHARAAVELGGRARNVVRLLSLEALLAQAEGDGDEARTLMGEALARVERLAPPAPTLKATVLNNLAGLIAQSDAARSLRLQRRALAMRIEALGPAHPDVAMSEMNLGLLALGQNDPKTAVRHFDAVIEIALEVTGADDPGLARVYLPRARAHIAIGDLARAQADAKRAAELAEAGGDPTVIAEVETLRADVTGPAASRSSGDERAAAE